MSDRGALVAARYRLLERVATGGMGVVWRGWDERLHRVVAVKELLVHPGLGEVAAGQAAQRAMREARITARLHHPHAIGVYDAVEQDGRPYLIMEYLPSYSLQHLLTERTTLGVEEVAAIGSQIAAALGAAHRAGIVHRDVKPGNVLLTEDGTAKLTDFGISRAVGDVTVTTSGMVTGTPAYLAPEVATGGAADFPADVFSFGSTLYAALEGHPPFGGQGNPIAVLHRVASGHVIPPRRCGRLMPLITGMLQHVPARRPTMPQVEQALAIAAADGAAPATSQPLASPSQQTQQLTLAANPPANQAAEVPRTAALPPTQFTRSARPPPPPPTRDIPRPAAASPRRRNRWLLIAATAAIMLVLTGAVITIATTLRGGKATTSSPPAAPKIAGRSTAAATTPVVPSIAAGAPPASVAATTTAASSTTVSSPSATTPVAGPPSTPADAITSYYMLVPHDLADAWNRLTASYQQGSGGFDTYQQFWHTIAQVTATDVAAQDDGFVLATIRYVYNNGKVVTDRTSFGLVQDNGQLKINSTRAVSPNTR